MNTITIFKVFVKIEDKDCAIGEVAAENVAFAEEVASKIYALKVHCVPDRELPIGTDGQLVPEAYIKAYGALQELEYVEVLKGSAHDDPICAAAKRRARVLLETK